MRKIISLYQRNYDGDRLVRDEVVPGAEWVIAGEGIATRKWDGTCCLVRDGKLYKRYDAKQGKQPPAGFEPAQDPDPQTGHWPGWLLIGDGPEDRYFREAFSGGLPDGTYELCGPKIQSSKGEPNPEGFDTHVLVRHGQDVLADAPRDFASLRAYFETHDIEGIVFWRDNGDMVKIKAKDFGLRRPAR